MIHAFAAQKPSEELKPFEYEQRSLGPVDVGIKISYCGLCHSDIHLLDGEWGSEHFPIVAGHEIIGTIDRLGSDVKDLSTGQRIGVSWQASSCLECEYCKSGFEQLCSQMKETCVGNFGGFSDYIVTDSRFVYPIPEKISSAEAAPLMCAGITVYQPLKYFGIKRGMKVGIIGIGGLGHLAIQFAKSFGCVVTAISTSPEKEKDAKRLGADHFISDISGTESSFDILLDSSSSNLEWDKYLSLLKPLGKLIVVGIPSSEIKFSPFH